MATRKGINVSGNYAAPIYTYFVFKKNERSDKIASYILFKTQRPSDTVF